CARRWSGYGLDSW
nr:immunoglobulin heavy chain junction region [Macaca mulatta]MOV47442.1 immunoglobulin heavy chain junction region [Macaca mulatta]MOV47480.1 immunoglobulin heavy chain junction region [Macaca mulatta]MOV47539.1 immunoglobulin heavy chain junction region [Macaca mulatta]MOV47707.1 immunoglobulin heavy chain junction region [Macaca mulatta]